MLEVIDKYDWSEEGRGEFEDQWFSARLRELGGGGPGARLPDEGQASEFAVETVWREEMFGLHQFERWHGGDEARVRAVREWCPEWGIAGRGTLY